MIAVEKFVVEQREEWKRRDEEMKARERELSERQEVVRSVAAEAGVVWRQEVWAVCGLAEAFTVTV